MKEFTYTLTDPQGMHARPAGLFVKQAAAFPCDVSIEKDGKKVNAKGILGVMSLGAKQGHELHVIVEGDQEEECAEALEAFLKENL
ncbi:MAG: HPr family phosphocarrier protein [Lachnospiraceae bacterium]|nr:HPr family phosphocarrier protein [Lachnospiraceae bacterium]